MENKFIDETNDNKQLEDNLGNFSQPVYSMNDDNLCYLKEMEDNAKLFEIKMKRLENYRLQCNKSQPAHANNTSMIIEKLTNELNYKNSLLEELKQQLEQNSNVNPEMKAERKIVGEYSKDIEALTKDCLKKDMEVKKYREESEREKQISELLKKEIMKLKSNQNKTENVSEVLSNDLIEKNEEIKQLKAKVEEYELQIKKINLDYSTLSQNYHKSRKEIGDLLSKIEELKAENYNLIQEKTESKNKTQLGGDVIKNSHNHRSNFTNPQPDMTAVTFTRSNTAKNKMNTPESEVMSYFPSERKIKESKNEMTALELNLSQLLKEKLQVENEMFKLPEKPRTLNEIHRRKSVLERMNQLDCEINEIKTQMRKLKI